MYKVNEDIKVKVTPEESREIQELAFKDGFSWAGGADVQLTKSPYLFLNTANRVLCHSLMMPTFTRSIFKELTPTELIRQLSGGLIIRNVPYPHPIADGWKNEVVYKPTNNNCDCGEATHNFGYHVRGCPAGEK